jgi:heme o synthase
MKHTAVAKDLNDSLEDAAESLSSSVNPDIPSARWRDYIGVLKVGITVANLFTTFVGFYVASDSVIDFAKLFTTLLGTACVVAGGCALNNFIDRDIDQRMARTQKRALVQQRLEPHVVRHMGVILSLVGLILLGIFTTPLAAMMGFIGLITYVWVYTIWLKRTSPLSTVIGGIAGAVPPLIGWTAVTGQMDLAAWTFFVFMFLWQPPHFLALAMKRCEEYRAAGIPLLPVVKGFMETKQQIFMWTMAMVPTTFLFFLFQIVGKLYLATALVLGILYIVYAGVGFRTKDDIEWSKKMFKYSLVYMNVLFLVMIFDLV